MRKLFKDTLDATITDRISISQAARDLASEEKNTSGAYDFSNMTPQQMQQAMNDLIKSEN